MEEAPIDSKRAKLVFTQAAEIPNLADRQRFVDDACGVDVALRDRVMGLLRAFEDPKVELDKPLAHALEDPGVTTTRNGNGGTKPLNGNGVDDPWLGVTIVGRYKLLQRIGEGGMGHVYMAEQLQPVKRKVAVKIVKEAVANGMILARFEAERQALAIMDHPNIAKVLDAGTTGSHSGETKSTASVDLPFFVMELVKGVPITQYCDERRLDVPARLGLFRQVCHGVQHAHQKGVIHRDLKPSNVLVEEHDGRPLPKVIDFGLAKATGDIPLSDRTLFTALGMVAGTPLYMAPEQASFNALDIDTRADVYALGVILYELLTGSTPIERDTLKKIALDELLRVIREREPQTPSHRISSSEALPNVAATRQSEPAKLGRFVRGELDWIAMKALAKERERRYESAAALSEDIDRFLNHEPVRAGPPSSSYRIRKFVRRNRVVVAAAAVVLLALVGGVVGTSIGMLRARQASIAEQRQREIAEEERRSAQAVNDFLLKDLLSQSSTHMQEKGDASRDPDIKVRTLLDRSGARIGERFAGQPLTEATIRLSIGQTYRLLTRFAEALAMTKRGVELREKELGPQHPDTLTGFLELGELYYEMGKFDLAEPLLERARKGLESARGAEHAETVTANSVLAKLYITLGRYAQAEELHQKVLDTRRRLLGEDDSETLVSIMNLALIHQEQANYVKAEPLYRSVVELGSKSLGADHPTVISARNRLGMTLRSLGKFDLAEQAFKAILDPAQSKLPPDDIEMVQAWTNLGATYSAAGRASEAIPALERAVTIGLPKLGPDNTSILLAKSYLAVAMRLTSQLDRAESLFKELIAARTASMGAEHPATLVDKLGLAQVLRDRGKLAEAEKLLKNILAIETKSAGSDSPRAINMRTSLGMNYIGMRDGAAAEPHLAAALAARTKALGPEHPTTLTAKAGLAEALMLQGKHAEAAPLLVSEYDSWNRMGKVVSEATKRQRIGESLDRLIRWSKQANRPEDEKKWQAEKAKFTTRPKP